MRRLLVAVAVAVAGAVAVAAAGGAPAAASTSPPLTVPAAELTAAMRCSAGVDHATRAPVLLVHGTAVTARETWTHVYIPGLEARHVPWCTVDMPQRATGDIQTNAQYVVHAIRELHRRASRPIAIIGSSQGGMLPRWALRFWPDTRAMVDDLVGLAPSNHGTTIWPSQCGPKCQPAQWQQSAGSRFMQALNAGQETFAGISYTNVYTRTDETVRPNTDQTGSSSLHTGDGRISNVAIQDICPADPSEHVLLGFADPVGYALAIDALDHDGPADPARVGRRGCAQLLGGFSADQVLPDLLNAIVLTPGAAPGVPAEPALACYVTATCAAPPRCRGGRRFTVRADGGAGPRLRRVTSVALDGRRLGVTRRGGRFTAIVDLRGHPRGTAVLRIRGRDARGRPITRVRRYHVCRPR